jgi:hypothetical protein
MGEYMGVQIKRKNGPKNTMNPYSRFFVQKFIFPKTLEVA